MKLSMWILADWLKKYNPVIKIQDGSPVLRGVRMLSPEKNMNRSYMQLGYAKDFFYSSSTDLICVHDHDFLILKTDDIDEVFNDILEAFDYYNDWTDRLVQLLNQNCSLQEILDDSLSVFDDSLSALDSSYMNTIYAFKNNDDEISRYVSLHKRLPENLILSTYQIANRKKHEKNAYMIEIPSIERQVGCRNLFINQQQIGWITLISNMHPISPSRLQLLDVLGDMISQWLLHGENRHVFTGKSLLFQKLLEKQPVDSILLSQTLTAVGWNSMDTKVLYVIKYERDDSLPAPLANVIDHYLDNCICVFFNNILILIVNEHLHSAEETETSLKMVLRRFHACCGKSYPFTDFHKLSDSYNQACTAISYGDPDSGAICYCGNYGLQCLQDVLKKNAPAQMIHPVLEQLKTYDVLHHTMLYDTLYCYLLHERNQYESACVLHIHRNTLLYRIQKICDLSDINLDDEQVRQYLLLSYMMI